MRLLTSVLVVVSSGCWVFADPVTTTGKVLQASGVPGVKEGTPCTVEVLPEGKSWYPCRVTITCAGQTLYGGPHLGGYTYCETEDHHIQHAWDDKYAWHDGDPWLELDMQARLATIRNQRPDNEVVVELVPAGT
jgi:hypothetical protein